ncbi:MAG: ABC transporter ATP-binding protein, partial [Syntrophorhabdaceae bacterium]
MPLIETRDVNFAYTDKMVLNNISVSIHEGEIVTLLGPNGSGKSTLLKLFMGLIRPHSGIVRLNGR